MPNKALMLGLAFGVAGLLLIFTVMVGGPGSGRVAETAAPVDPELYLPPEGASEQLPIGDAEGIVYELKQEGILFYANKVVPRTEGEIDVLETTIRIILAPGRELIIEADEGTIVAPDMHPTEGEMRGHVIVTLYETPDGSDVDTDSDRDVVIRMYFDDPVDFDLELQQIDSAGSIFMTGPQVQYRGRGLSLNFNQLRERVERLVIEEGESLRYIPEPVVQAEPQPKRHGPDGAAATREERRAEAPTEASTEASAEDAGEDKSDRPVQYYLATFEQLKDVRVGPDQYVVQGDELSAIFSAKSAAELDDPDGPDPATSRSPRSIAPDRSRSLASADAMSAALAYALSATIGQVPDEDPRSLATFTDEDVVITWEGRLVVSPLSEQSVPEAVEGPKDVMVTVKGTPATISTDQGQSVRAPTVSFLSLSAGLLAQGTDESPVFIDAPDLGSLTGVELAIDQSRGTGYVVGPGSLTGLVRDERDDTKTNPLTVEFADRLDLAFYLEQDDARSTDERLPVSEGRIKGVKSADFLGDIRVGYFQLDMTADRLTLALVEDAPEDDDKLAVESLTVAGNVEALVKEEDVRIHADRLLADPANDQLELFGTPDAPARVVRPDATLAGERMVMDEQARTVVVPGPGRFDFLPDADDPGQTVSVTWATRMSYDDLAGAARFEGDVRSFSADGADTNELMGDDLNLTFVEAPSEGAGDEADPTAGRRLATATVSSNVRFRARSHDTPERENILTELFLTGPRMEFTDPGLVPVSADEEAGAAQTVQVIGVGRMLITDTRPEEQTDAQLAKADAVDFAGRGLTAFEWSDRLVLDLTNGEMLMRGAVAMVHQPEDGDRVQLDCLDLAAELEQPKGKKKGDGWLSEDAPQPELSRVWADGGIRILTADAEVTCDHLLYEEDERAIILWSDDPNVVVYQVKGEPTPARSSAFKWHRDTGRVEAFRLRTGTIPLRRSERE